MPTSSESSIALRKECASCRSAASRTRFQPVRAGALAQLPYRPAQQQDAGTQGAEDRPEFARAVTAAWSAITVSVQPSSGIGPSTRPDSLSDSHVGPRCHSVVVRTGPSRECPWARPVHGTGGNSFRITVLFVTGGPSQSSADNGCSSRGTSTWRPVPRKMIPRLSAQHDRDRPPCFQCGLDLVQLNLYRHYADHGCLRAVPAPR